MLIQLRMFLEMGFQLCNLPVLLLAGLNGASQSLPINLCGVIVLPFDFEDVHDDHVLFFLLHVL